MTCVTTMAAFDDKVSKDKRRRKRQTPDHALKSSLRQATAQKRLTVGLSNCVNKLKRNPESVMVCLQLQEPPSCLKVSDKAASNIQHTLLQAFCTENRISLVRVLADPSLVHLVRQLAGKAKKDESDLDDCNLLILEHPVGGSSAEDSRWMSACQGGQLSMLSSSQRACE